MLIIRQEQMDVLNAYMNDKFTQELAVHIAKDFPEACQKYSLDENNLRDFVQNGLARAKEMYGIDYKDDLTLFVECMVLLEPNFDQSDNFPWAKEILTDEKLNGAEKMEEIDQYMIFNLERPL